MNLQQFLKWLRPNVPFYLEIVRGNWIKQEKDDRDGYDYVIHVNTPDARWNSEILRYGVHTPIEIMVMGKLLIDGVKSFRFSAQTMEAMENYDLSSVLAEEYHQPFPTMVIEFPDTYCDERVIPFEGIEGTTQSKPRFAVINRNDDILNIVIRFDGQERTGICFVIRLFAGKSLEKCWEQQPGKQKDLTEIETNLSNSIIRACLNACMLAAHYGTRSKGAQDPYTHASNLSRLKAAQKKGDKAAEQEQQLKVSTTPIIYEINQEVAIFREERGERQPGEATGRHVSPHWRRGHWRTQRFGEGLSQSKKIPIPAVLVNAGRLLGGDASHTSYTATE